MGVNNLKEQENKRKVIISVLKIFLLLIIVVGIPLYIYFFQRERLMEFDSFNAVVEHLGQYKLEAIPIYIGLQIIQIVISVIPGQVFQLAAGYPYTFLPALILSVTGAILGTMVSFYLARFLGSDFVHLFFGREKTLEYVEKLNSKKAYMAVFLIYLIPGIPKDVVSYAAGISEMKFKAFLILSVIGRLPGMMGSIMIGSMWHKQEYFGMIALCVLAVAAFVICILFRKKINGLLDKIYNKITS